MPLNQFNYWFSAVCKDCYVQGLKEGESEFDDAVIVEEEELYSKILSVDGVDEELAERIVNKLLEE